MRTIYYDFRDGEFFARQAPGGHAGMLLETATEIVLIGKAYSLGDGFYFHIACRQQFFGAFDAHFHNEPDGRHIDCSMKYRSHVLRGKPEFVRERLNIDRVGKVLIGVDCPNSIECQSWGIALHGRLRQFVILFFHGASIITKEL